jgi:hypothetical protein
VEKVHMTRKHRTSCHTSTFVSDLWAHSLMTGYPSIIRKVRVADNTAGNLRVWTAAFAGSVKAITESLCYGLISNSPVNGIRCRIAQVSVENAPIPTAAKLFRQRMNAG